MRYDKLIFVLLTMPLLLLANSHSYSHDLFNRPFTDFPSDLSQPSILYSTPRPILSGPVYYIYKPHLIVHYTTSGADSTSPAYAESIAVFAETSWARATRFGWYPPAPDAGRGDSLDPDTRYDIFIVAGLVSNNYPDSAYTNPFPDGYSGFIGLGASYWVFTYDTTKAFTAHEFHHTCQARYSNFEGSSMYEMTSMYMAEVIFPGTSNFFWQTFYWPSPLIETWYQINSRAESSTGGYWGRNGIWMKFLHEHYGQDAPLLIWYLCGMHAGTHPYWDTDSVLKIYFDSNMEEALGHFAIWRYFTGNRDDGQHFYRANELHTADLHATHSTFPARGDQGTHGPRGPGGMNLIEFNTNGTQDLSIEFNGQTDYHWRAYALCIINSSTSYMQPIVLNDNNYGSIRIPAWMTSKVILIPVVVNWYDGNIDSTPALNFTYTASLVTVPTGFANESQVMFMLNPSSPNPVRSHATISYTLPKGIEGCLRIIDVTGRLVKEFEVIGDGLLAKIDWDRNDRFGRRVNSGIYFYQLSTSRTTICEKMVVE